MNKVNEFKSLFLVSKLGGYTKLRTGDIKPTALDNSNHFVDRLKKLTGSKIGKIVYVTSNPEAVFTNAGNVSLFKEGLMLSGFEEPKITIIDNSFEGDLDRTIESADMVYLSDGDVLNQLIYFQQIGLRDAIKKYHGIIVAEGSGMINCSEKIYYQPKTLYELLYPKKAKVNMTGLGLTKANILPHYNTANTSTVIGDVTVYNRSLRDCRITPHYMLADGSFIEIEKDSTVRLAGDVEFMVNGKRYEKCKNGKMMISRPKSEVKPNMDN